MARAALADIESGKPITLIDDNKVNRMLVCGKCERSKLDPDHVESTFKTHIQTMLERLFTMDEIGQHDRGEPCPRGQDVVNINNRLNWIKSRQERLQGGNHG